MNYTYIVRCADDTLYTGWTNDLENRIKAHNEGRGAKYTRCRRPVSLFYYEEFQSKTEAMSREYAIKRMTRRQKLALAAAELMAERATEGRTVTPNDVECMRAQSAAPADGERREDRPMVQAGEESQTGEPMPVYRRKK